jgi:hypothetical protein
VCNLILAHMYSMHSDLSLSPGVTAAGARNRWRDIVGDESSGGEFLGGGSSGGGAAGARRDGSTVGASNKLGRAGLKGRGGLWAAARALPAVGGGGGRQWRGGRGVR